jgi:TPR repeat protein
MKQAAAQGHADAEGGLGYFYSAGVATARDDAEAVKWFRRGAEKGSAKAQFNLGRMMLTGRGVEKDERAAMQWIARAAEQRLPEALQAAGEAAYLGSYGVRQDYAGALELIRPAAEAGLANAQNTLGVMLREGHGAPRNEQEAEQWFRRSATQGNARAWSNLGHLLISSTDRARRVEGFTALIMASDQAEITATRTLEELLEKSLADEVAEARRAAAEHKRNPAAE